MNKLVALDLEMNQPSNKIIQIGISMYCPAKSTYTKHKWYVNPGENLTPYIEELTGIENSEVKYAPALEETIQRIKDSALLGKDKCKPMFLVWGTGDLELLSEQLGRDFTEEVNMLRSYIDVRSIFRGWSMINNKYPFGGLKRACNTAGIGFEGIPHRADVDAYNTLRIFNYLNSINLLTK